jgi:hypothetical protein
LLCPEIPVDPPFLKHPEIQLNDLGLPLKEYYTTGDICTALNMKSDTFRARIRAGFYPEVEKIGGRRRFTEAQMRELIQITMKLRRRHEEK